MVSCTDFPENGKQSVNTEHLSESKRVRVHEYGTLPENGYDRMQGNYSLSASEGQRMDNGQRVDNGHLTKTVYLSLRAKQYPSSDLFPLID